MIARLFPARGLGGPSGAGMSRRSRWAAVTAVAAAVPLVTGMTPPVPGASRPGPAVPRPVRAARLVPVHPVRAHKVAVPVMHRWRRPAVSWPAAGEVTVTVTGGARAAAGTPAARGRGRGALVAGASAGSARAGTLPVWVGPAAGGRARAGRAVPARVRVVVAPQRAAAAAGIRGVIFTLGRADGLAAAGRVHASLSYSSFAAAYGGDYAARLHLVLLPACALTTPRVAACRVQAPLASADDTRTARLGADVTLPGASAAGAGQASGAAAGTVKAAAGTVVMAATPSPSGSGGDYRATPLSEAGSWNGGGSSGAFTYSYPIDLPPVPGGLRPKVTLGYDSQAVDGLTSTTDSQASWIGDGWGYSPGFIERAYQPCSDNPPGPSQTGDLCWPKYNVVTLSLGDTATTLVQDSSTHTWHALNDDGARVSYRTGTGNGTSDGGYWVVTTTDGTSYYFGVTLPGYVSGDTPDNATWTVPVYATAPGQQCYNATFASSHCTQAWQWNLDYVTDSHGNAIAYFYNKKTNYYAADKGTTATAGYTQAGVLSKIEYGLRAGSVYGVTPAAQVNFSAPEDRTDVPADLTCASGAACSVQSPTFWGKYRLATITTQSLKGSALANVDSWALAQTYPSTGDVTTPPALWLSSISRTGLDGGSVSLPPVRFAGLGLANRVETPADLTSGYSIMTRFRLTAITNQTGGVTGVSYDTPGGACTSGNFPPPDANTGLCYPDYWAPSASSGPVLDWFNKYVVTAVTQQNTVGGGVPVSTSYCYSTSASCLSGAAWRYNDNPLARSKQRTWDQWRGFGTVITRTGTAPDPVTETVNTYFRGMDGNYQSGGSTAAVSVADSLGEKVTDANALAGRTFEQITRNGAGGATVTDTITNPWISGATATDTNQPSPLPALSAYMTGTAQTRTYTALAGGGTREHAATNTHDSYGRVTSISDQPDTSGPAQDTCTTISYASNTGTWLLDLPAEETTVSVPCGTTPSLPADAVSDTRTFYDGSATLGAAPTAGDPTMVRQATSYSGSAPVYTTQSTATYDQYGRVLTAADADNRTTTTAYTPATGAEPTSVTVTDPAGLATTTSYDPARALATQITTPAGYVTSETYGPLGWLTGVWKPGHPQASTQADLKFSYTVSATAPSVITTQAVNNTGGYTTSETLYDSLGRAAETQAQTADPNRTLISDTYYNSDGWQSLVSGPYVTGGGLSAILVAAPDDQVPSQTGYVHDGAGRVVRQISYKFAAATWETDTAYGGNYVTTTPPQGGTPQTTFTDGRGLTTAIYQYHSRTAADPAGPAASYDKTSYTYTPARQLATITDAAGNTWSYSYDLLGHLTSQTAPDTGTATSAYDPAGQLMSATDARGKTTSYTYDADGRESAAYGTTGGAAQTPANQLAAWTYDTIKKGLPTSSASYVGGTGGDAYTTRVLGYNSYGLPTGTQTIIPPTEENGNLAGTYTQSDTYDPYTMALASYYDTAAGGLPAETVRAGYDTLGQPASLGSSLWYYVAKLTYTDLGQPQEYTFGTTAAPAWLTLTYDQQTGRVTGQQTVTGSASPVTIQAAGYTYDNAGNPVSESDSATGDYQCFAYDYLARLTDAWAQGSSGCAASPSADMLGGPSPYWQHLAYDVAGNLTASTTTYSPTSTVSAANSYPAPGAAQPHTMTSQQVTSAASGSWTNTSTYDAAGNLTTRQDGTTTRQLTWNDQGKLAQVSDSSGNTTRYVYDASGNLLLQRDPGKTTLFLPDEELVLDTSAHTVTGTRLYSLGGATIASRTSDGKIAYLINDLHGTAQLAIGSATLQASRRYYTPYGALRGPQPSSWPAGAKGYVGGTTDTVTALTNLGAREYNTDGGTFTSPDALQKPYDPQDLNPYAYAENNPITSADPTGMLCTNGPDGMCKTPDGHLHDTPGVSCDPCQDPSASGPDVSPAAGDAPTPGSGADFRHAEDQSTCSVTPGCDGWAPSPAVLRNIQRLGYQGPDKPTEHDLVVWLSGVVDTPRENSAWDYFCQGLLQKPMKACAANPFTGRDTYGGGSSLWQVLKGSPKIAAAIFLATQAPAIIYGLGAAAAETDAAAAAARVGYRLLFQIKNDPAEPLAIKVAVAAFRNGLAVTLQTAGIGICDARYKGNARGLCNGFTDLASGLTYASAWAISKEASRVVTLLAWGSSDFTAGYLSAPFCEHVIRPIFRAC
jgi:RHS repeat-associated protein